MLLVVGIDAATWRVIRPNLDVLVNFKRLIDMGEASSIVLKEKPISAAVWCGMFSGKLPEEHGHTSYVKEGKIVRREDINVEFVWDILDRKGKNVKAINVPFVVPPYSFGVEFEPVGFGLPTNEEEWMEELERVTEKTKQVIAEGPDLVIAVYTLLDRIQHFHWGEDCVVEWYRRVDEKLGEMVFGTGVMEDRRNKLIVVSDHGFCGFGEAKVQTLPRKTEYGELKGDHHEEAILITVNVRYKIEKPQDVFYAIMEEVG